MTTDNQFVVLVPELWKQPDHIEATFTLLGLQPYLGSLSFNKIGFGRVKVYKSPTVPHIPAAVTHQILEGDVMDFYAGLYIILPEGFDVDWGAYHSVPDTPDDGFTPLTP